MGTGAELRQARERADLSAEQIADRTKIQLYKIQALENDTFERLPDGIYLDGIIRAYAREVAIDPEPLIERVHQKRTPVVHVWQAGPDDLNAFPVEQTLSRGRPAEPTIHPAKISDESSRPARGAGRFVLPLLLLLAVALVGAYFLQTRDRIDRDTTSDTDLSSPVPSPPSPRPVEPDRSVASAPPAVLPSPDTTSAAEASRPVISRAPAVATSTPATRVVKDVRDLSGAWTLATRVESSSYARFEGLHLGYEIELEQAGDRVKGAGRKVTQNGDGIRPRAQTPISVDGTINGDRLTLTFNERGARRPTQGKFVLLVAEGGTLRGRFSSTAAHSSGTVEAHRLSR